MRELPTTVWIVVTTANNGAFTNAYSMIYDTREAAEAAVRESEEHDYLPSKGLVTLTIREYRMVPEATATAEGAALVLDNGEVYASGSDADDTDDRSDSEKLCDQGIHTWIGGADLKTQKCACCGEPYFDADTTDVDVYLGRMGESAGGEMGVIDGGSLHPIVREFWSVWATRPMDGGELDMLFEKDFDLDQEAEARAEAAALAKRYGVDYATV